MSNLRAIPTISLDAVLLYERLKKLAVGDVITYDELDAVVSRDVRTEAYHQLVTARKKALSVDLMCFAPVRGIGIKRLSDVEIVATGESFTRRVRRTSGKALRTLASVADYAALGTNEKNRYNVSVTIHGALLHSLKPAAMKRIEEKVSEANAQLAIAQALQAFGG